MSRAGKDTISSELVFCFQFLVGIAVLENTVRINNLKFEVR